MGVIPSSPSAITARPVSDGTAHTRLAVAEPSTSSLEVMLLTLRWTLPPVWRDG